MSAPTFEKQTHDSTLVLDQQEAVFKAFETVTDAGHSFNELARRLENRKDDEFHPHGRILVSRQDNKTPEGDIETVNEILLKTVGNNGYYSFVGVVGDGEMEKYVLRYEAPSGESGGSLQVDGYSDTHDGGAGQSAQPERFTMVATEFAEALRDASGELDPEDRQAVVEVLTLHADASSAKRAMGSSAISRFFAKLK